MIKLNFKSKATTQKFLAKKLLWLMVAVSVQACGNPNTFTVTIANFAQNTLKSAPKNPLDAFTRGLVAGDPPQMCTQPDMTSLMVRTPITIGRDTEGHDQYMEVVDLKSQGLTMERIFGNPSVSTMISHFNTKMYSSVVPLVGQQDKNYYYDVGVVGRLNWGDAEPIDGKCNPSQSPYPTPFPSSAFFSGHEEVQQADGAIAIKVSVAPTIVKVCVSPGTEYTPPSPSTPPTYLGLSFGASDGCSNTQYSASLENDNALVVFTKMPSGLGAAYQVQVKIQFLNLAKKLVSVNTFAGFYDLNVMPFLLTTQSQSVGNVYLPGGSWGSFPTQTLAESEVSSQRSTATVFSGYFIPRSFPIKLMAINTANQTKCSLELARPNAAYITNVTQSTGAQTQHMLEVAMIDDSANWQCQ